MRKLKLRNSTIFNFKFLILNSRRAGFTIVELMIAITITVLAMAAVYTSFIVQQRSFTSQDQVSETQGSSKIAFDMIAADIRTAGFGYPLDENPTVGGVSDSITASDAGENAGADSITLVGGYTRVGTLTTDAVVGQNSITVAYSGTNRIDPTTNKNLSIDGVNFVVITACAVDAENNCVDSQPLTLDRGINIPFPAGRNVYLIEDVVYTLANMQLQKQSRSGSVSEIIVDNIEDLQFAYAVDTDNDDQIDDQNGNGVFDPDDYYYTSTRPGPLPANSKVMAIRVSIVARTANEDPTLQPNTKPYYTNGIRLENNTTQDTDKRRRRIWRIEVALRNPR